MDARFDTVVVPGMRALRVAGRALVVAPFDPARGAEVLIPHSQIAAGSEVRAPGDSGRLAVPRWLAEDRRLVEVDDGDAWDVKQVDTDHRWDGQ